MPFGCPFRGSPIFANPPILGQVPHVQRSPKSTFSDIAVARGPWWCSSQSQPDPQLVLHAQVLGLGFRVQGLGFRVKV